ncbi:MAG: hypothetical protein PHG23_03110 [Candidatus Pacebacteria bacterium]|nr:hypothetical protein [Candidatus Paceibacterota bacterium]
MQGGCTTCTGGGSCCGGPRGTDNGCPRPFFYSQNPFASATLDPCTNRWEIDCKRQELNYRVNGRDLALGLTGCGYNADIAPFINSDGTLDPRFLTLNQAKQRLDTFKQYFSNRLSDLQKAKTELKDNTKNYLSLSEFQTLQQNSTDKITVQNFASSLQYDVVAYCRDFNCTKWNKNDKNNLCIQIGLFRLQNSSWPFSPDYQNDPKIKDKRVCGPKDYAKKEEAVFTDGDSATFYKLVDAGTTDPNKYVSAVKAGLIDFSQTNDTCSFETEIKKEMIISRIPLGELADRAENYAKQLIEAINGSATEIQNSIDSGNQLIALPDNCKCSANCGNSCIRESCDEGGSTCNGCTSCEPNGQKLCDCCGKCGQTTTIFEDPPITFEQDFALGQFGRQWGCNLAVESDGSYSTYCPCSGLGLFKYGGGSSYNYEGAFWMPNLLYYDIVSCTTQTLSPPMHAHLPESENLYGEYTTKSIFTVQPKPIGESVSTTCATNIIDQALVDSYNWRCTGSNDGSDGVGPGQLYDLNWLSEDTFEIGYKTGGGTPYFCACPGDLSSWAIPVTLPAGYTATCEQVSAPESYVPMGWNIGADDYISYDSQSPGISLDYNLKITLGHLVVNEDGDLIEQPYYVCPYNTIETEQCHIYKRVEGTTFADVQAASVTGVCKKQEAGYLQRLEIWQQRLWNLQYPTSKNLLKGDENRATLLDLLSVSRERLEQCIQGYGLPFKENLAKTKLFTCDEGITAVRLKSYVVLPDFPYPAAADTYNCYPFNAPGLTAEQKQKCFENKDRTGSGSCQEAISNYINDYYCCTGR